MSTPVLVILAVIGWCLVLFVCVALGMAASDADDAMQIGEGWPDRVSGVSLPTPDTPTSVSSTDLHLDVPEPEWQRYVRQVADEGPVGGVE